VAEQTEITLEFCQALAAMVLSELGPDVPVFVWDERYTSKEAAARAHSRDPGRLLYGKLDAEAACIILEHFYVDNGVGAFPIVVTDDEVRRQCLESYEIRRRSEEMRKVGMMKERERKLQRRKDSIARARELEEQQRTVGCSIPIDKRKKRKKKR
jgi:Holliday junction resolvase